MWRPSRVTAIERNYKTVLMVSSSCHLQIVLRRMPLPKRNGGMGT
jgi:hypothetical protein